MNLLQTPIVVITNITTILITMDDNLLYDMYCNTKVDEICKNIYSYFMLKGSLWFMLLIVFVVIAKVLLSQSSILVDVKQCTSFVTQNLIFLIVLYQYDEMLKW